MSTKPRRSTRARNHPARFEPPMEEWTGSKKDGSSRERKNNRGNEPDDYLPYDPKRDDPPPLGCIDLESAGIEPGPDKDGYYFVEDIEGRRWHKNGWQFYCSWKGYSRAHNTWEPYCELNDYCKALVHERFTRRGQGLKSLTLTEEQQRAVDEALHQSRMTTANTNEKNKYKDYEDSESESIRPYSGFVDADYCPSDTDQDSLDNFVADDNSITSKMDHTFYKDDTFSKATAGAVVTPTPVKLMSPYQSGISFPTPTPKTKNQKSIQSLSRGKKVKQSLSIKKAVVPKGKLALNKHFAEILHSYARFLQKTDKPINNKQERIFTLVTELGRVIHKEEESVDSYDCQQQQQHVAQQSESKSVGTTSYDCGKVTCGEGDLKSSDEFDDCGDSDDGYATQDETISK